MTSIWWVRRDLRITDNAALQAAIQRGGPVVPVFVLDPHLLAKTPGRRQQFLFNGLRALDGELTKLGSGLVVRNGSPQKILFEVMRETGAQVIFTEEDFSPYARSRDAGIAKAMPLELIHGQTVLHPLVVHKTDGNPYTVFTPFSKAWKSLVAPDLCPLPVPDHLPILNILHRDEFPTLLENANFPAGEHEALQRLKCFINGTIYHYGDERDRVDLDGTSALSPYFHFGMISMRQAVHAAMLAMRLAPDARSARSAETWLNELIWREFYISILYHFPRVCREAFNRSLGHIIWRENEADFEAWCLGRTGVPIVDAGMRQLAQTGWMHNRARMITASYLVKDLLINWQRGERWFMNNLLDGDTASNNGGWQWIAGTGTDAAPYFRIFNPLLQSQKFDPDGAYIRKWVPELAHLSGKEIYAAWGKGFQAPGYPSRPVVEHIQARQRALRVYKVSKSFSEANK